ncbi:MAG: MBL fold metallo-hydrolase [Candidatus Omnitrophica bacterium]|nr:MBL fold metallo-hydrolase [Candidatus Omnitrophota bacterium]
MKVTFLGAAENVTGSKFLIEQGDSRILLDCGLHQERDLRDRNWDKFPVDPSSIEAMILTHAHIDHCGYIPKLVKDGFRGKIYCTAPTAEIAKISLLDSAKLQIADAQFKKRRHEKEGRKGPHPEVALYDQDDVRNIFPLFHKVSYEQEIRVAADIKATFYDAGHILGSAMIELKVNAGGQEKTYVFSGDIGRWGRPILGDPHAFSNADAVVMEATYGNRLHEDEGPSLQKLVSVINQTKERGGNIIIPSFAINRTQEILYYLNQLLDENRIPHLMTFVDSPMAASVTEIYEMYPEDFDEEAKEILTRDASLFHYPLLKMTKSAAESKAINHIKGSAIIIAGSGMCTGGRIKHHLVNNIARPESTILFVGYQAVGTLGRYILEKPEEVRILGKTYPVQARIEKINGFSAHADKDELLKWVSNFKNAPEKIFIVHSEKEAAAEFSTALQKQFAGDVIIPKYTETHDF